MPTQSSVSLPELGLGERMLFTDWTYRLMTYPKSLRHWMCSCHLQSAGAVWTGVAEAMSSATAVVAADDGVYPSWWRQA